MWKQLQHALARLWRWSQRGRSRRKELEKRERFWAQVREGQREAETRLRP